MSSELVALGSSWLHLSIGTLHTRSRKVALTAMEQALVSHLADHAPEPVSKQELLAAVWGYRSGVHSHTLKTTVSRLRRKMGPDADCVRTVPRAGYALLCASGRPAPAGDVTLAMLTASAEPMGSGTNASFAALDRVLEECADSSGFAFFDAPSHLGLAFSDPDEAVNWALSIQRAAAPSIRVAIGVATATDAHPPHYASRGRDRASALAADAQWSEIAVGEGVNLALEVDQALKSWIASAPPLVRDRAPLPPMPRMERPVARGPVEPIPISDRTSTWVGRATDWDRLERLFADGAKLVTLTGPGGIGKTRLATRYAATIENAVMVPIGSEDLGAVRAAFGQALDVGVPVPDAPHPDAAILRVLNNRQPLVVVDNAESGIGAVRHLLSKWLHDCGESRFLVTSRERLNVEGEWSHQLSPLSESDACLLFCQRASAIAGHDIELDDEVSALVEQLDGLPLAIELAAGQTPTLGVLGVLESMEQRFEVLRDPARKDRHAALDTVIRESWDRLNPAEQRAFTFCSTFEGSFTSAAASVVLSEVGDPRVLLPALVRMSLLQPVRTSSGRLVLLDSLRAFARDRLVESGEEERAFDAHGAWAMGLTESGGPGFNRSRWLGLLLQEESNIHVAARNLVKRRPDMAVAALEALDPLFDLRGRHPGYGDAIRFVTQVTRHQSAGVHARSLKLRGYVEHLSNRWDRARVDYEDAATLASSVGDEDTEVRTRVRLAVVQYGWGSVEYTRVLKSLMPRIAALADPAYHAATLLQMLSPTLIEEPGTVQEIFEQVVQIYDEIGGDELRLKILLSRCRVAWFGFDFPAVVVSAGPARRLALRLGRRYRAAFAEGLAGLALVELGDDALATERLGVAIREAAEVGESMAFLELGLARLHVRRDELDEAEALCLGVLEPIAGEVLPLDRGKATVLLGQIAELRSHAAVAIARYRSALETYSHGRHPRARESVTLALAGALADRGQTDECQALVAGLQQEAPGRHPSYPLLLRCTEARWMARSGDDDDVRRARGTLAEAEADPGYLGGTMLWSSVVLLRRALEGGHR